GYLAISGFFKKIQEAKDASEFDLIRDRVLLFQDVQPNQVSINMTRVQQLSGINAFELTQAEVEGRLQIKKAFAFLKKYIPGFENSRIVRTPYRIGVRETRHVIGEYVMQVNDILNRREFDDSICLSAFPIDIHSPKSEQLEFFEQNEDKCYEIPIRVLIPKGKKHLIVTGRCISATHEANASLRVTPSVMALGEAAGVLGALCAKKGLTPVELDYRLVQEQLKNQGQVIKKAALK
ncbi:MAG: FAD-dependent oxidoreductase, partial [Bacilli bacterium]